MKKIALFGGSGKSGQAFLTQALAQGYTLKALARNPASIPQQSAQLQVIQGDVLDAAKVAEVVAGAEVVVSLFGHVKGSPAWVQTEGTKNTVAAMQQHGIKRLISLSGGGLRYPEKDQPKLIDKFIRTMMQIFVPQVLRDAEAHAEVLKDSPLDWVIVRGPRLTLGHQKGNYRVGWVGVDSGTQLSRADLAHFILQEIESPSFVKTMPFVSY